MMKILAIEVDGRGDGTDRNFWFECAPEAPFRELIQRARREWRCGDLCFVVFDCCHSDMMRGKYAPIEVKECGRWVCLRVIIDWKRRDVMQAMRLVFRFLDLLDIYKNAFFSYHFPWNQICFDELKRRRGD